MLYTSLKIKTQVELMKLIGAVITNRIKRKNHFNNIFETFIIGCPKFLCLGHIAQPCIYMDYNLIINDQKHILTIVVLY